MNTMTLSGCHTLELIPIDLLTRFARVGSRVLIQVLGTPYHVDEVPGTVKVSSSSENGVIKKKITFERVCTKALDVDILSAYKSARLIATYRDEKGNRRVSGSPNYPLSLNFTIGEGVFSCELEGEDTEPDAFL